MDISNLLWSSKVSHCASTFAPSFPMNWRMYCSNSLKVHFCTATIIRTSLVVSEYSISQNSLYSTAPLLSWSIRKNTVSKLSGVTSRRVMIFPNSRCVSKANLISSMVMVPEKSASISEQILNNSALVFLCSIFFDFANSSRSLDLASAALSTMTARIKFMMPNDTESTMATVMMAKSGCASITGTLIVPQLSPAMMVWNNESVESTTDLKPREQRSQSP
mmetsp:Transcript_15598/g.41326  ORF Transcript_15598/g.41326 Transcript_15598/m.41326 type:complete len:220 (+) Transcript_15598:302-961(+)